MVVYDLRLTRVKNTRKWTRSPDVVRFASNTLFGTVKRSRFDFFFIHWKSFIFALITFETPTVVNRTFTFHLDILHFWWFQFSTLFSDIFKIWRHSSTTFGLEKWNSWTVFKQNWTFPLAKKNKLIINRN